MKRCAACGEEKQRSEFYKDARKKDGLYSSCKECTLAQQRKTHAERYANDPEYRERMLARQRKRYADYPEFREKLKAYRRNRFETDPEYREKVKAYGRERHRERYANDPEYREKHKAKVRKWQARKRKNGRD